MGAVAEASLVIAGSATERMIARSGRGTRPAPAAWPSCSASSPSSRRWRPRRQRAPRPGGVVLGGAVVRANAGADRDLVADRDASIIVRRSAPVAFGRGQRRGDHHRPRMPLGQPVAVVVVEYVGEHAVRPRRAGRAPPRPSRSAVATSHAAWHADVRSRRRSARPALRPATTPDAWSSISQASRRLHVGRDVVPAQARSRSRPAQRTAGRRRCARARHRRWRTTAGLAATPSTSPAAATTPRRAVDTRLEPVLGCRHVERRHDPALGSLTGAATATAPAPSPRRRWHSRAPAPPRSGVQPVAVLGRCGASRSKRTPRLRTAAPAPPGCGRRAAPGRPTCSRPGWCDPPSRPPAACARGLSERIVIVSAPCRTDRWARS